MQRLAHVHGRPEPDGSKNIVYLYVSGQQAARPDTELAGCKNGTDPADPTNSLYQLDIIKVPLDHPEQAEGDPGRADLHRPRRDPGLRRVLRSGDAAGGGCAAARGGARLGDRTPTAACTRARTTATT